MQQQLRICCCIYFFLFNFKKVLYNINGGYGMSKIYVNQKEVRPSSRKDDLVVFILELFVSALTLMLASSIFKGFYVENIVYAMITSLVISMLNVFIKPILIYLTLPVTVMSLGLLYPIVNVIILKLASLIMGSSFVVEGWILPFFIAIFISAVTKLLEKLIVDGYRRWWNESSSIYNF